MGQFCKHKIVCVWLMISQSQLWFTEQPGVARPLASAGSCFGEDSDLMKSVDMVSDNWGGIETPLEANANAFFFFANTKHMLCMQLEKWFCEAPVCPWWIHADNTEACTFTVTFSCPRYTSVLLFKMTQLKALRVSKMGNWKMNNFTLH